MRTLIAASLLLALATQVAWAGKKAGTSSVLAGGERVTFKGQPFALKAGETDVYELSETTVASLEGIRQLAVARYVDTRPFLEKQILSLKPEIRFSKGEPEACETNDLAQGTPFRAKALGCVDGSTLWLDAREFARVPEELQAMAVLHVLIESAVASDNSIALDYFERNLIILSRIAREGLRARELDGDEVAAMKQFWVRAASIGMPVQPIFRNRLGERKTNLKLKDLAVEGAIAIHPRGAGLILNPRLSRVPGSAFVSYDSIVDSAEIPEDTVVIGSIVRGGSRLDRVKRIERSLVEGTTLGRTEIVRDSYLVDSQIDNMVSIDGLEAVRSEISDLLVEGARNWVIDVLLSGPSDHSAVVSGSRFQAGTGSRAKVTLASGARVQGSVVKVTPDGMKFQDGARVVDSIIENGKTDLDQGVVIERSWLVGTGFIDKGAVVRNSLIDSRDYAVWRGSVVEDSVLGADRNLMVLIDVKLSDVKVNTGTFSALEGARAERVRLNQGSMKLYSSSCVRLLYGSQQVESVRQQLLENGQSDFDCDPKVWEIGHDPRRVAIETGVELRDVIVNAIAKIKFDSGTKLNGVTIQDPNPQAVSRTAITRETRGRYYVSHYPSELIFTGSADANGLAVQLDLDSFTRTWGRSEQGFKLTFSHGPLSSGGKRLLYRRGSSTDPGVQAMSFESDRELLALQAK